MYSETLSSTLNVKRASNAWSLARVGRSVSRLDERFICLNPSQGMFCYREIREGDARETLCELGAPVDDR